LACLAIWFRRGVRPSLLEYGFQIVSHHARSSIVVVSTDVGGVDTAEKRRFLNVFAARCPRRVFLDVRIPMDSMLLAMRD
jgi:hypothetical protein